MFHKIPQNYQGVLFLAAGVVLLLHTLGFFTTGLSAALILASLFLIGDGLVKLDAYNKLLKITRRHK